MNALPTGLYHPGASPLHRLCPWVKLLCLLLLLAAVVMTDTLAGYGILVLLTGGLILLSRLPVASALSAAWRLKWFFLVIFLMNLCFYGPEKPWFRLWILQPSLDGLIQGGHIAFRMLLLLILSNLLTATTPPLALTEGIEILFSPLKLLRLPVGQIAMILSVAIQFIPTLLEETDAIRKAQTARGARFDSPKLWDKAAAVMPLAVPIFLAAFKRADELSLAMEARGYRANQPNVRRSASPFVLSDALALLLCLCLCAVQFFIF